MVQVILHRILKLALLALTTPLLHQGQRLGLIRRQAEVRKSREIIDELMAWIQLVEDIEHLVPRMVTAHA